jgi:hypothetical protein
MGSPAWWFSASDHQVKIVLLTKSDHLHQRILIATRQASGAVQPVLQQDITMFHRPYSDRLRFVCIPRSCVKEAIDNDDDYDSDNFQPPPPPQNPWANAGKASIASMVSRATLDRKDSKVAVMQRSFHARAPATEYLLLEQAHDNNQHFGLARMAEELRSVSFVRKTGNPGLHQPLSGVHRELHRSTEEDRSKPDRNALGAVPLNIPGKLHQSRVLRSQGTPSRSTLSLCDLQAHSVSFTFRTKATEDLLDRPPKYRAVSIPPPFLSKLISVFPFVFPARPASCPLAHDFRLSKDETEYVRRNLNS